MKTYRERFFGLKSDSRQTRDQGVHVQRGVKSHLRPGLKVFLTVFLLLFGFALSAGPAMAFTEGASNNFFGDGAGASNSGDNLNSFFGGGAGNANTTGNGNDFFGNGAGYSNTTGNGNSFFGGGAGRSNTIGYWNAFFGNCAGNANKTGNYNSFFGISAGLDNTTGDANAFFGNCAGWSNTTGGYNAFFGYYAGLHNTTGYYNAFFGNYAGYSNTVEALNTLVGYYADLDPGDDPETEPIVNATAIGANAYVSQSNSLVLGSIEGMNTADASVNVGIGTPAPEKQLHMALGDTPTVRLDHAGTGGSARQVWDVGGNATNFFICDTTNGSMHPFRIQPGTPADTLFLKSDDGGRVGIGTASPQAKLHVAGNALVLGNLEVGSSREYKERIQALQAKEAMEALRDLRPVRFHYKADPNEETLGYISEEVPDLVATESRKSLNTMDVVAVLAKVAQEQQKVAEAQQKVIEELSCRIVDLEKELKALSPGEDQ